MSGFGLVPVDGGDLVPLPPGETVLGRGPFLGVSDTRVSRRHALLENLDGQLRLKPTHINPCFLLSSPNDDPRPLERGSWHRLHPGDQFSLLPGRFIYRVAPRYPPPRRCHGDGGACHYQDEVNYSGALFSCPAAALTASPSLCRNSQKFEEEDGALPLPAGSDAAAPLLVRPGQEQTSCPDRNRHSSDFRQEVSTPRLDGVQSDEAPPPPRRRVLPAWMMAAAAASASKGVKRSKPAASQAPPTLSPPPEGAELREEDAERPRKKSRAMSSEEEILPTETDDLWDESTSRGQIVPTRSGVSSAPSRSAAAEKSQQEEKKTRSGVRTACPYGKDCYRKNPLHFQESSHPGDADYEEEEEEEEERPECPYGAACYRKNPLHRKQFRHTERPVPRSADDDPNDDPNDDPDSFISDDSGDDSDYEPQDDLQRQNEAKAFLRKRRR
ncbi:LOW QUALITY PROTEIN: aprataxin and PNK-like factor [Xiphophorus couchianus]|uniref:LOW QUALITY PROTEIN: aprataxin and PNK-like factor n=1 Tax=Xiphophorus couchianus TaxID=32473 RepID=UPI001016B6AD|nr:LOW QUALITY PROTEIN: aprataxin and PNK-like factor [Xiphophorus couchianus]